MNIRNLIKKIQNMGVYIISLLLSNLLNLKKVKIQPKSLLIIRLDSIGDYVLFRNFLEILKKKAINLADTELHYAEILHGKI